MALRPAEAGEALGSHIREAGTGRRTQTGVIATWCPRGGGPEPAANPAGEVGLNWSPR